MARGGAATRSTPTLAPLKSFVLPGGTPAAAQLHVCRTVCRRAERRTIDCGDEVNAECVRYLNRLSDLLFILSRERQRRRGAAVGARALPRRVSLHPAEHRAVRELHATARALASHWSALAGRLGGDAETPLRAGAATAARELLAALSAVRSCRPATPRPRPSAAGSRH